MILCIWVLSVVISLFSFLILLIWFFSLCFLMSLANGLSVLFSSVIYVRMFYLCLPLGVLWFLAFRSLTHFEFVFVYGVRKCSSFILLQVVDEFSQHHLLKRFSPFYILIFFVKDEVSIWVDLSVGLLFCSIDLYFCLCASTILS